MNRILLIGIFSVALILLLSGTAFAATGNYAKPVEPQKDMALSADSGKANCGIFSCEYSFYLDNGSAKSFSDLSLQAFFAGKATNFKLYELRPKTISTTSKECQSYKCVLTDLNTQCKKTECAEYKDVTKNVTIEENILVSFGFNDNQKTNFSSKQYEKAFNSESISITNNGKKKYLLEFFPLEQKGSFLLFAKADNNSSYASLDPDWDTAAWEHWKMNEASGDAVGSLNGRDLAQSGTVSAQTGKINGARGNFTGDPNYFKRTGMGFFTDTQSFTLTMWIKALDTGVSDYQVFAYTEGMTFYFIYGFHTGRFSFIYNGTTVDYTVSPLVTNQWYWATISFDGTTKEMKVDINNTGSPQTGTSSGGAAAATNFQVGLEGVSHPLDKFYIDDYRLYPKVLSATELAFIYNNGNGTELEQPEINVKIIDLNLWKVDGYDLNGTMPQFSYAKDGNLTITYFVKTDVQGDLNANIWQSTSQGQKTNKIVGDLNLSTNTGCDKNSSTAGMRCVWDFNSSAITDSNLFLTLEIRTASDTNTVSATKSFRVENQPPTTSISGCSTGWHNTNQSFTLSCIDGTGIGCGTTAYRLDSGAWNTYSSAVSLTTDLNHRIDFNSTDLLLNVEAMKSGWCAVDKTAPTLESLSPSSTGTGSSKAFSVHVNDATSGAKGCYYQSITNGIFSSLAWTDANATGHCNKTVSGINLGDIVLVQFRGVDNADNNSTDANTGTYERTAYAELNFIDEQTGEGVKPDSILIDSNNWIGATDSNGLFYFSDLSDLTTTTHAIIASKTGYGTRRWDLKFGKYRTLDNNLAMRKIDLNSTTISFSYYTTNGLQPLASRIMQPNLVGTDLLAGQRITNSSGQTEFFLDRNSAKYSIKAFDLNEAKYADYNALKLTIKIPKDEIDYAAINPYSLNLLNDFSMDENSLSTDYNWMIYSNTTTRYTITVSDNNVDYFPRQYAFLQKGNDTNGTLQPYLLKKTDGGTVKIYSKDSLTGNSLPNTRIVFKKYISSVLTTVEERITDISGIATFALYFNETYYVDAFYGSLSISNELLRPVSSEYTIRFNNTQFAQTNPLSTIPVDANYSPNGNTVDMNSGGWVDLNSTVFSSGNNFSKVIFTLTQDSNVIYSATVTGGGIPFRIYSPVIPPIDANTLTNNKDFDFNYFVVLTDGNTRELHHTLTYSHSSTDTIAQIQEIPNAIGTTAAAFLSIFITIIIVGLGIKASDNHPSISILGGLCLLLFGFLGFFPIVLAMVACLGGFVLYYLRSGY